MQEHKPVTLSGTRYLVRMTVTDSIDIEDELGMTLREACGVMSMRVAAAIVGHSIRDEAGKKIPAKRWAKMIEEMSVAELLEAAGVAVSVDTGDSPAGGGEEEDTGKN